MDTDWRRYQRTVNVYVCVCVTHSLPIRQSGRPSNVNFNFVSPSVSDWIRTARVKEWSYELRSIFVGRILWWREGKEPDRIAVSGDERHKTWLIQSHTVYVRLWDSAGNKWKWLHVSSFAAWLMNKEASGKNNNRNERNVRREELFLSRRESAGEGGNREKQVMIQRVLFMLLLTHTECTTHTSTGPQHLSMPSHPEYNSVLRNSHSFPTWSVPTAGKREKCCLKSCQNTLEEKGSPPSPWITFWLAYIHLKNVLTRIKNDVGTESHASFRDMNWWTGEEEGFWQINHPLKRGILIFILWPVSRGGDQSERMFQRIAKHFNERIIIFSSSSSCYLGLRMEWCLRIKDREEWEERFARKILASDWGIGVKKWSVVRGDCFDPMPIVSFTFLFFVNSSVRPPLLLMMPPLTEEKKERRFDSRNERRGRRKEHERNFWEADTQSTSLTPLQWVPASHHRHHVFSTHCPLLSSSHQTLFPKLQLLLLVKERTFAM